MRVLAETHAFAIFRPLSIVFHEAGRVKRRPDSLFHSFKSLFLNLT